MAAPPQNFPPPAAQSTAIVDAGFEDSPTGGDLCGFGIPFFGLSLNIPGFTLPKLGFALPVFTLGLNCDLSDPVAVGFGGGRISLSDPDADPDYQYDNSP